MEPRTLANADPCSARSSGQRERPAARWLLCGEGEEELDEAAAQGGCSGGRRTCGGSVRKQHSLCGEVAASQSRTCTRLPFATSVARQLQGSQLKI